MQHWHITVKLKNTGYDRFHTDDYEQVKKLLSCYFDGDKVSRITIVTVSKKGCENRKTSIPTTAHYEKLEL